MADQPADIEQQLRTMVLQYISNPNAIILAVSAATSDLATSDAIQLAKRVDPSGERTMGVITKLDLMDAGTDAIDVLRGHVIPLQRGFVGVVNRSQQDINDAKTLAAARRDERDFFAAHPKYRAMAARMGSLHLAGRLNELLLQHIRSSLPALTTQMNSALDAARAALAAYGEPLLEGPAARGALLLQLLTSFASNYTGAIDGTSAQVASTCPPARARTVRPAPRASFRVPTHNRQRPVTFISRRVHVAPAPHVASTWRPLLTPRPRGARSSRRVHVAPAQVQEVAREQGELFGGARIHDIFQAEYCDALQANVAPPRGRAPRRARADPAPCPRLDPPPDLL